MRLISVVPLFPCVVMMQEEFRNSTFLAPGVLEEAMRRVVVTGLGVVTPNGIGKDAFWTACLNGESGIRPIQAFDASKHPVRISGEVVGFDAEPFLPDEHKKSLKVMGR